MAYHPQGDGLIEKFNRTLTEMLAKTVAKDRDKKLPVVSFFYSALTLATSEPCQTGFVPFSKADISRTTGTWQVPVSLLISGFKKELNQSGMVLKLLKYVHVELAPGSR